MEIEYSLRHQKECYSKAFGETFYSHIISQPEKTDLFSKWCMDSLQSWMQCVFDMYDFTKFQHLTDVGGGQGHFLASILARNSGMTGTLFDQPELVVLSKKTFVDFNVQDRVTSTAGDFFQAIPSGADAYTICRTLLNWSDDDAVRILSNCYRAMSAHSKLFIIDFYIPEKSHPHFRSKN